MSLELKKIMLDLSNDVFLAVDKDGKLIDYNQKALIFLKSGDIKGKYLKELFSQYVFEALKHHKDRALSTSLPVSFVLDIDSSLYECNIYLYDFGCIFSFDDITEATKRSRSANEFSRRANVAQKVSKIGYFEMDLESKTTFFSRELYPIFGLTSKKNSRSNVIAEQIYSKDLPKYTKHIKNILDTNKDISINLRFNKVDSDDLIHCRLKASVVCDDLTCKIIGTIQDLTSIVEIEKKLKADKKIADKLAKARSVFITQASHDLRQPIQAMRMFIYGLKDENLNKKQKSMLENIDVSVESLSYLLDNLIDISKLDYGVEKYNPYLFSVSALVNKVANEYKEIAKNDNVVFDFVVEDISICSNPFFLERILRNLLSNAFKFTKDKVSLNIVQINNKLQIFVKDNGCGIKKSEIKYIFNEFFQSKNVKAKQGSLGLGLPIVKKMADLLGAKIDVKSKVNGGSTFSVELPIIKEA